MNSSTLYSSLKHVLDLAGLKKPLARMWSAGTRFGGDLRKLEQQLELRFDEIVFARNFRFLEDGGEQIDPDKIVLIVSLTDWPTQVKMEGMLAKALQIRGYTPVILTRRSNTRAHRYFKVFGFERYEYFDDFVDSVSNTSLDETIEALLAQPLSFGALLNLKYRDVYVGRHVLSSIVRTLRQSGLDLADPRLMHMLRERLPNAMRIAHAAERLMDHVQPQLTLFLEKGYTPVGQIFDIAVNRGIDAIQYCHSQRNDALILKRYNAENRHQHPFTLSAESWSQIQEMPWTEQHESALMRDLKESYAEGTWFNRKYVNEGKQIKSAAEVREQLELDPEKKTAVIFSHVLWDATFFYGENLFDDYEHWLVETVQVACENTQLNWVIKLHPDYVWKMKKMGDSAQPRDLLALAANIGELPSHIRVVEPDTDISTYSFFEITDYCLTVRGTIGIEMPCFGVPVFTAGTGRYSGLGFTHDSVSREDYLGKLRRLQEFHPLSAEEVMLARKHAYALFEMRPCPFRTFEMIQKPLTKLGHALDHNLVIRAKNFQEIRDASDLHSFANWAQLTHEVDFLVNDPIKGSGKKKPQAESLHALRLQ